jgi:uncharacterized protein involved in outer membrane biogenesis
MRLKTAILIALAVLLAIPASILAVALTHDFSDYKSEVQAAVKDLTGRTLTIDGRFKLEVGLTPKLVAGNVRFSNAPWGTRKDMVTVRRFEVHVAMLPLLQGKVEVKRLVLVGADVLIETNGRGVGNWAMQRSGSGSTAVALGNLRFRDAKVVYRSGRTGRTYPFAVQSLSAVPQASGSTVRVDLAAVFRDHPFTAVGTVGRFTREVDDKSPWPADVVVRTAGTELKAKGRLRAPFELDGMDALVDLAGPDLSRLNGLFGDGLPSIGPYRVAGRLRESGRAWTMSSMQGGIGETAFSGEATVAPDARPQRIRANLAAKHIDVEALLSHLDLRSAGAARPASGARGAADARLAFDLPSDVNGEVALRAERIRYGRFEFQAASLTATLDERLIILKPLSLGLADGEVTGSVTLDERSGVPRIATALVGRGLDATRLLRGTAIARHIKGRIDVAADFRGAGATRRALVDAIVGKVGVEMGTGQLDNGYFNVLSSDVLRALTPWAPRQEPVKINCMMAIFDLRQGVGTSRVALLDTSRAAIVADGSFDLRDESLSFAVWPRAKDVSLMRLMVPLRVSGAISEPSVYPDPARLLPGAVGIVTGIFESLGSLIGIGGGAKGSNRCRMALAAAMKKSGTNEPFAAPGQ